jgi:hypothetical protein
MDRPNRHEAVRRVTVALVVATGLVLGRSAPAIASGAPTPAELVSKLTEEDVCEESAPTVIVGKHEVTCRTDLHGGSLIRLRAYSGRRGLQKSLRREIAASCAASAGERRIVLVVGPTWYAMAAPSHDKAIARWLDGEVKSYACP